MQYRLNMVLRALQISAFSSLHSLYIYEESVEMLNNSLIILKLLSIRLGFELFMHAQSLSCV